MAIDLVLKVNSCLVLYHFLSNLQGGCKIQVPGKVIRGGYYHQKSNYQVKK